MGNSSQHESSVPSSNKHSPLSITSFAIGLVSIGIVAITILFIALNPIVWQDGMVLGPMLCSAVAVFSSFVGLILGVAAAVQVKRNRTLAIWGIVLNSITAIGPFVAYVIVLLSTAS